MKLKPDVLTSEALHLRLKIYPKRLVSLALYYCVYSHIKIPGTLELKEMKMGAASVFQFAPFQWEEFSHPVAGRSSQYPPPRSPLSKYEKAYLGIIFIKTPLESQSPRGQTRTIPALPLIQHHRG